MCQVVSNRLSELHLLTSGCFSWRNPYNLVLQFIAPLGYAVAWPGGAMGAMWGVPHVGSACGEPWESHGRAEPLRGCSSFSATRIWTPRPGDTNFQLVSQSLGSLMVPHGASWCWSLE